MPGNSSFLPCLVLRSTTHTESISVNHMRLPLIQMPFGLFSVWPAGGKNRFSRIFAARRHLGDETFAVVVGRLEVRAEVAGAEDFFFRIVGDGFDMAEAGHGLFRKHLQFLRRSGGRGGDLQGFETGCERNGRRNASEQDIASRYNEYFRRDFQPGGIFRAWCASLFQSCCAGQRDDIVLRSSTVARADSADNLAVDDQRIAAREAVKASPSVGR